MDLNTCWNCHRRIEMMVNKNTGLCSENCRKRWMSMTLEEQQERIQWWEQVEMDEQF